MKIHSDFFNMIRSIVLFEYTFYSFYSLGRQHNTFRAFTAHFQKNNFFTTFRAFTAFTASVAMLHEVQLLHYQMTTNSAVNKTLAFVF